MRLRTRLVMLVCLLTWIGCTRQKSTEELIGDLKSTEEKDRVIAVRLLQQRKADASRTIPALIEALKDPVNDIRWSAAIGLGYYKEQAREAIPALQEALNDRDARVREGARVALSRIDPNAPANPTPGQ